MTVPSFPPGFLWGASASAFQTEGASDTDGKGPSGWDAFAAQPGRIKDGTDTTRGTGFHQHYREDVALLAGLGADAFRFSVSWPRVVPGGSGPVNPQGLDFYDRLVDELCAHGITPAPTLYHWDTPLPLDEEGGWLNRDTAYRFAEYAGIVAERLADRVPMWITINEPAEVTLLGYALGEHAPGRTLLFDALPAAHHQLLAHGLAVRALRGAGADNIGIAVSHTPVWTMRRPRRGPAGRGTVRHHHQLDVRRPGPHRPLPRREHRRDDAGPGRGRPRDHLHTARLVRDQLLQPHPRRRPRHQRPGELLRLPDAPRTPLRHP